MSKKKDMPDQTADAAVQPEVDTGEETPAETCGEQTGKAGAGSGKEQPATYTLTAEEFETAKKHIETLQKEKDDTVALLQRNQADFDNYRRRNAAIRMDSYEEGRRDVLKALLPVLDNFDRAMANDCQCQDEGWRDGVRLVHKQLLDILAKQGLSEVPAEGAFDPNFHEAVLQEKAEGKESGDILAVLQKGYQAGEKIIRHSMVKVAE